MKKQKQEQQQKLTSYVDWPWTYQDLSASGSQVLGRSPHTEFIFFPWKAVIKFIAGVGWTVAPFHSAWSQLR